MAVQLPIRQYNAAGGVVVSSSGERVLVLACPKRLGPNALPEVRLPKGHVELGESPSKAAIREVCEEAGLDGLKLLTSLGQQTVEFDWKGYHYIRDESYFLLCVVPDTQVSEPEAEFERLWLPWAEALAGAAAAHCRPA